MLDGLASPAYAHLVKWAIWLAALGGVAHADDAPPPIPDLPSLIATAPPCDESRRVCIGIRLHVPSTDEGPITDAAWIERQLANANKHFAPLDVAFQIVGIEAAPESSITVDDRDERVALGALINGKVIDVFVTTDLVDIDKPGNIVYGVTWWTVGDRKFVILSTQAWERTLAHELGHVFGLPHSKFAISIMNKRPREKPPMEERTFHSSELAKMKPRLKEMLRAKVIENLKR